MMKSAEEIDAVVAAIKGSKKYQDTSEETIRALAAVALSRHKKPKKAVKAVRKQLHSIMAPYLGDPDYVRTTVALERAFSMDDEEAVKKICGEALYAHLSTRERLPIMTEFFQQIFAITGLPSRLLDIACGLNPLAFPWMGLPPSVEYFAYDIHEPRIDFINDYFRLQGLAPLARLQDVALHFPEETADVALFLKEMPRFERNYSGTGRAFLESLRVKYLVLSFPTISTHGGRSLVKRYRDFYQQLVSGHNWPYEELMFENEMVFIAEKNPDV